MELVYLNRLVIKVAKRVKNEEVKQGFSLEEAIREDIRSVYNLLSSKPESTYGELEKQEMLVSALKHSMAWKKTYGNDFSKLKTIFPDVFSETLQKWKLSRKPEILKNDKGIEVHAGFSTDYLEINEFKGKFTATLDNKFGSFRLTTASPIGLIFLYCPYGLDGRFKRVIKMMLSERNSVKAVKWDDSGLRRIYSEDGEHLVGLNVSKIEGDVHASVTSNSLDERAMYRILEEGSFNGITYKSRKYPGNVVKIYGWNGYLQTDLDDSILIDYFKQVLMKQATTND